MSSLKVVHCIGSLPLGGTEMALSRLLPFMPQVDSTVVSLTDTGVIGARIAATGIRVVALDKSTATPDPRCLHRLRQLIARERPDIVQTWLYEANLYGLVASRLAGSGRVVWGLRCADMPLDKFGRLTSMGLRLNGLLSRWPDAIVSNSSAGLRYHQAHGIRSQRCTVIPNGFDLEAFRPDIDSRERVRAELAVAADAPVIGVVARDDPAKDIENFMRAAMLVHRQRPDAVFVLAGSGLGPDNLRLHRALCAMGFRDRWRLLGVRTDMTGLMNGLDLLAVPSCSEGFPNVLGEAMACATPSVSTDVGDAALILADPDRTVPRQNPAALARALLAIVAQSAGSRAAIGARDRGRIRQYSLAATADQYLRLYRRLGGRTGDVPCAA